MRANPWRRQRFQKMIGSTLVSTMDGLLNRPKAPGLQPLHEVTFNISCWKVKVTQLTKKRHKTVLRLFQSGVGSFTCLWPLSHNPSMTVGYLE